MVHGRARPTRRWAAWLLLLGALGCAAGPSPRRAERDLRHARSLAARGRTDDAIEELYTLLDTYPTFLDAHLLFIALRSQTGRAVVQSEYERKLKAEPDSALLHFLAGRAAADPHTKRHRYRKAVELNPDFFEAYLELGRLCRADGAEGLGPSRQALEAAVALRPASAEARLELARTLDALGLAAEALAACRRAVALARSSETACLDLAGLVARYEPAALEPTLADALRACPRSGDLWWRLACAQWHRGAHRDAARSLWRALDRAPEADWAPDARDRLAAACLLRGWHRTARRLGPTAWTDAAADMADGTLSPEAFRSLYEASQGGPAERAGALDWAARLSPNSGVVQRELGEACLARGRYGPAAAAFAAARQQRPDDASLRDRHATAELLAGRADAALAILRQAARRTVSGDAAWLTADAEQVSAGAVPLEAVVARHAAGLSRVTAPGEYRRLLAACIEKFPSYLAPRVELARALREAGKEPDAQAVAAAAAGVRGHRLVEAELLSERGALALADGAPDKAVEHYRAAAERNPASAPLQGALARAAVEQGDFVLASHALARQLELDPASHALAGSAPPDEGQGCWLLPRLDAGDVLRYRYSTDGGQPGRAPAVLEFDYVIEAAEPGHLVLAAIQPAAVGGRLIEGGSDFVGAKIRVKCSSCFGLVQVDAGARRPPREFAYLVWLAQFLHGPALPAARWPGQAWRDPAWTELGRLYAGETRFDRARRGLAHLTRTIRLERTFTDPTDDTERIVATGEAAVLFDLEQRVLRRLDLTMRRAEITHAGSRAELPPWLHQIELLRIQRGMRKANPGA